MPKKKKKSKVRSMIEGKLREDRKEAGIYDGRFAPKVIPNKKKKADKDSCRKFKK